MDIRELSAEEHQAIKTVFAIAKPEIKSGSSIITLKDGSRIFYSADGAYIFSKGLTVEQKDQRIHEFAVGLKAKLNINGHTPPQAIIDAAAQRAIEQAEVLASDYIKSVDEIINNAFFPAYQALSER